jgi:hypothetical protein
VKYDRPTSILNLKQSLEEVLLDDNWAYMHKLTHLHSWQVFMLAERLQPFIEQPRDGKVKVGPCCKHDHFHRLFFCLKWLNDGNVFHTREVETGWGKSSIHRDTCHVLQAIVEGLDDELQWPNMDQRQQLASTYDGIFCGCIGISNVKEFEIEKPGDPVIERRSFSEKKIIHLRCCLPWITVVIIFLLVSHMGRMTERCIPVAPFTFRRVIISLMENSLLLMGHLMVMEVSTAPTKTLEMIQQKNWLT